MKAVGVILLVVFLVIFAPFIVLWGINELLQQAGVANQVPYNFWTWLATICVSGHFRPNLSKDD